MRPDHNEKLDHLTKAVDFNLIEKDEIERYVMLESLPDPVLPLGRGALLAEMAAYEKSYYESLMNPLNVSGLKSDALGKYLRERRAIGIIPFSIPLIGGATATIAFDNYFPVTVGACISASALQYFYGAYPHPQYRKLANKASRVGKLIAEYAKK